MGDTSKHLHHEIASTAAADADDSAEHPIGLKTIELLAPAGGWDCARAAIENGADAIYFGLEVGFNARVRATNFHLADLPRLMDTLHRQGVRGYVTLNTLVFTDELQRLEEHVRQLAAAGVDAVLVQDLGAARLIRAICPSLALHASTQMTLTNAATIEQVRELGIERVVLARELSIREISQIHVATDMPLEVFVHGALCVAYSGQCLTSESLGGRSANRGHCAQACRLPYDLICDGQQRDLGPVRYLLSPQDLAAHDLVPQLLEAGVCSLKIEGRLKSPEYVANTCQQYRRAIDCALLGEHQRLTKQQQVDLEMSFSRGFSPGWLEGCDHKQLVPGLSSTKRGVLLGKITHQSGQRVRLHLECPLAIGDGVVLEGDRSSGDEIGGRVYEMWQNGNRVKQADSGVVQLALQYGLLEGVRLPLGVRIYKTDDPHLTKRLRSSFRSADPTRRLPVDFEVQVTVGQPIRVTAKIADLHSSPQLGQATPTSDARQIVVYSQYVPEEARKHPLTQAHLTEQLSRLGGTVYQLRRLTADIIGSPMVPLSELGQLRRSVIMSLDRLQLSPPLPCTEGEVATELMAQCKSVATLAKAWSPECDVSTEHLNPTVQPLDRLKNRDSSSATVNRRQLRVLCRSLEQLRQVLDVGVRAVIADFHDLRQYRAAVLLAMEKNATIEVATLRIHKPGEDGLFPALRKFCQVPDQKKNDGTCAMAPVGWLVRNLAAMRYCQQNSIAFATDFSLNVTNPLTVDQLLRWGADRVTASYDLNRDQMIDLVRDGDPSVLEVVIHQHMPMFHMEHCVFCSVLSPGRNKSDCGRPCDRHDVKLRDRVGAEHVLHADIGCRNTLYNATAQSGAEAVASLVELGVQHFRIELLRDSPPEQTGQLIELYQQLVAGAIQGSEVWRQLKADNRIGVTRGTLEQPRNPLTIL